MGVAGSERVVAALTALLLVATLPAGGTTPGLVGNQPVSPDDVLLAASLAPDGDADWRIEYRVELADENDTAAFESLAADVRANRSRYAARFAERMRPTVRAAANATGREMAVRNVSVRTGRQELGTSYGVLVYTFEWTNFAAANDTHLRAGDALAGLFLDERTALRLSWPSGYRAVTVDPPLEESDTREDRAVVWRGPEDFGPNQPRLVVTSTPPDTATGGAPPADGGGTDEATGNGRGLPILPLAAVIGVLALLGAAGWLYAREDGADAAPIAGETGDDGAPPEELLSNEERVLRLLEENGGRMKQQDVVDELGWTDAKTSQVVGDLREDGEVETFRLGRENVVTLPGHDLVDDEDDT